MKKMMIVILALTAHTLAAQQKNIPSEITAVTLYSDRAHVVRSADVSLAEGNHELIFKDLPYSLDDQSLRVEGSGTAAAKITDIKIETVYIDTLPKNALKDLQDQLTALNDEEKIYADRIAVLMKEIEFLDLIKKHATTAGQTAQETVKPSIDEWTRLFAFYDANYEKINLEARTLEKKKQELQSKKSQIQQQINRLSGYSKLTRKRAVVNVTATRAGQMKFNLSYVLTGARWYPFYDVRVSQENQSVELTYYAMIAQNTGEDWKDVNLSISTARPNISGSAPVLSAWYLNVYTPYYASDSKYDRRLAGAGGARSFSAKKEKSMMEESKSAEVSDDESSSLIAETATIEQRSTSVVFNIKKPATIPADNFDHKVTISIEKLKADFLYAATPKIAELAYLKGKIENITEVPFLAGKINLFFGNSFVGTSEIPTVIPTEKFDVSLGIDDAIKIKREQVKDYRSETGIFSKNIKKSFEYKITVESFRKTDDTIIIQDQFPIPQDERIKVEAVLPDFKKENMLSVPNGVVEKKSGGIVEWRLKIKPKEKTELRIKYNVEYPGDIRIEGL